MDVVGSCRVFKMKKSTLNAQLYQQQLKLVHKSIVEKYPARMNRKIIVLKARPHVTRITEGNILEVQYWNQQVDFN